MKYIVYCTTCTANGKIYIGVHKTEDPDKFDNYIGNGLSIGWNIKNPSTAFQYAIKKYGYSSFKRSTLFVFDNEEDAYQKEAEIVNLDFIKRRDNYNTALGGKYSTTHYKTLYQYDLNGNFIAEWFSVQDTCKHFNCHSNRLNIAIREKRSAFNSYWSYEKIDKLNVSNYRLSQHSETYQYDQNGNLIEIFNSIKEIQVKYPNLTKDSLCQARSKKRLLFGYYWLQADVDVINLIKINELFDTLTDKSISKYKNGLLVKTYTSISQAAKENHIARSTIKKSMQNNEGIWSYGFSQVYKQNINPIPIKVEQYDLQGNLIRTFDSIAQCTKQFKRVRQVLRGKISQIQGYTFKIKQVEDIV